jgi:hypothetical protein
MPANKGHGVEGRLNSWLTLLEERTDLRGATDPGLIDKSFEIFYATLEGTGHLGLVNAAKFFGLDHRNPAHRVLLLYILADVVFHAAPKGRRKGSAKWTGNELMLLGSRAIAMREKTGKVSNSKMAEKLKEHFNDYGSVEAETIRQRLPAALQVHAEVSKLVATRMDALKLSLPEYIMLLAKEYGMDRGAVEKAYSTVCRRLYGSVK